MILRIGIAESTLMSVTWFSRSVTESSSALAEPMVMVPGPATLFAVRERSVPLTSMFPVRLTPFRRSDRIEPSTTMSLNSGVTAFEVTLSAERPFVPTSVMRSNSESLSTSPQPLPLSENVTGAPFDAGSVRRTPLRPSSVPNRPIRRHGRGSAASKVPSSPGRARLPLAPLARPAGSETVYVPLSA
ncbi:MAG: hypothetical protein ABIF82_01900 [Planctomycetota bacterium]